MYGLLILAAIVYSVHSLPTQDEPYINGKGVDTTVADGKHDSNGLMSSYDDEMRKSEEEMNKELKEKSPSLNFVMNTIDTSESSDDDSYVNQMIIELVPDDSDETGDDEDSSSSGSSSSSSSSTST